MNVTPIARTWHPALLPPVIPTGEQAHRLIELANMLGVDPTVVMDLILHIENHPEPTPRPAALDHLDTHHDGRIYRYYAGHLGSITLPRAGGHVFDGLTPATGRDWHDAAFATGIYRCADRGVA